MRRNNCKDFFKELNNCKRELNKFSESKIKFVKKCYDDVVEDISNSFFIEDGEYKVNSSEIIRDYKIECIEEEIMSEEEFDKIYDLIDFISIESSLSYC